LSVDYFAVPWSLAMNDLCLPARYQDRPPSNDNWEPPDEAMNPVYRWIADRVATDRQIKTVLDWGCGSGAMLVKHFGHLDTLGADVPYRLARQRARFPDRRWAACPIEIVADLVVCVDAIEHLDDPLAMLGAFNAGLWRHLFITTPDRALVAKHKCRTAAEKTRQLNGPPRNPRHTREWTRAEFEKLVTREIKHDSASTALIGRFNIVSHLQRQNSTPG
jgi:hypothetical protein